MDVGLDGNNVELKVPRAVLGAAHSDTVFFMRRALELFGIM